MIAEEVAEVNSSLVARNSDGQTERVHYEMVNAMLLNEFVSEHDAFLEEEKKGTKAGSNACDSERTTKRTRGKNRYGQRGSSPSPVAAEPLLGAEVLGSAHASRARFDALAEMLFAQPNGR